jgi:hypothetical protein
MRQGEAGILHERRAPARQPCAAGMAFEQPHANLVFQVGDLSRQCLLCYVKAQGSAGKASLVSDGH